MFSWAIMMLMSKKSPIFPLSAAVVYLFPSSSSILVTNILNLFLHSVSEICEFYEILDDSYS